MRIPSVARAFLVAIMAASAGLMGTVIYRIAANAGLLDWVRFFSPYHYTRSARPQSEPGWLDYVAPTLVIGIVELLPLLFAGFLVLKLSPKHPWLGAVITAGLLAGLLVPMPSATCSPTQVASALVTTIFTTFLFPLLGARKRET